MSENECPICLVPFSGNVTTFGCCRKTLHTSCYFRCMQNKLECPMCRAPQESLGLPGNILPPPQDAGMRKRVLQSVVSGILCFCATIVVVKMYLVEK